MPKLIDQIRQVRRKLQNLPHEFYWNISPEIGQFFKELASQRNCQRILEVGCSNGYSALWFAEALTQTGGHLWTIESNHFRHRQATRHFRQANVAPRIVTLINGHAPEILDQHPEVTNLDFVFLDATKAEYPDHLARISPRLATNAVVIADNITSHWEKQQPFLQAAKQLPHYNSLYAPDYGTGMVLICPTGQIAELRNLCEGLTGHEWRDLN